MKNILLFVVFLSSCLLAAGGDTVKLTSRYIGINDFDTVFTWWWTDPVDSIVKTVNGKLGNINIASDANILPSKLDSTSTIVSRRIRADTIIADSVKARALRVTGKFNGDSMSLSVRATIDSLSVRVLAKKGTDSLQINSPSLIAPRAYSGLRIASGGIRINSGGIVDTGRLSVVGGIVTDSMEVVTINADTLVSLYSTAEKISCDTFNSTVIINDTLSTSKGHSVVHTTSTWNKADSFGGRAGRIGQLHSDTARVKYVYADSLLSKNTRFFTKYGPNAASTWIIPDTVTFALAQFTGTNQEVYLPGTCANCVGKMVTIKAYCGGDTAFIIPQNVGEYIDAQTTDTLLTTESRTYIRASNTQWFKIW